MNPRNFPNKKLQRRKGALQRLKDNKKNVAGAVREYNQQWNERVNHEIETLETRIRYAERI